MTNAINWLIEKSEIVEKSGEYGSYKMWNFKGRLPTKMVQELRKYVRENGKLNGDVYNIRLEYTETYGKTLSVSFGNKRTTENIVKFKMIEEWAA